MKTPSKSRRHGIFKLQSPSNKKIQEVLGVLNFVSEHVYKKQLFRRPYYNIHRQQKNFDWT